MPAAPNFETWGKSAYQRSTREQAYLFEMANRETSTMSPRDSPLQDLFFRGCYYLWERASDFGSELDVRMSAGFQSGTLEQQAEPSK